MLRAILGRSTSEPDDDPWDLTGRVERLESAHKRLHPDADLAVVRKAYRIAEQMHRGQDRKSGEPYITHPIAVAHILADLGMDTVTVTAALLHDTVEDTSYTLQRLRDDFDSEVALLVDGVTKLDKMYFGADAEAETFRKLIVAAGHDVRVMVIKLADRLHNMRTIGARSRASQVRIAEVTRTVLIPLADRLGLYVVKRELEDIVLSTVDPEVFAEISGTLSDNPSRKRQVAAAAARLRTELRASRMSATVMDRPRHHYSVYREMAVNPRTGLSDPPRLVVIVNGPVVDCYAALGAAHRLWRPIPGRFKDFIATPKFNLYQSLHTSVLGPENEPTDLLIRTAHMHELAERGVAAQLSGAAGPTDSAAYPWLHRLVDWQRDAVDSARFLDTLQSDLAGDQILVFTTSGGEHMLPAGSTPVDLAYCTSASDGDRLVGAYVNGKLSPLAQPLAEGDLIETITAETGTGYPGPSRDWLDTAKTPQAKLLISQWFAGYRGPHVSDSARNPEGQRTLPDRIHAGRHALDLALRRRGRGLASTDPLLRLGMDLGYSDLDALYAAVYDAKLDADELVDKLIAAVDREPESAG